MKNRQADFYIVLPNSEPESWVRWMWADAEKRAVLLPNNTPVSNICLVKLKKAHFSNKCNKYFWLPMKTIWDITCPVKPEMFDLERFNYIIFHSGVKFSPHYIRKLKQECNVQIVLYLPDTLAGLNIAHNEKEWARYKDYYLIDQVYSFDMEDCKRYGLKFFDFYSITNVLPYDTPIDTDLFYVGSCRNPLRLKQAADVLERVRDVMRCDFHMIGVSKDEMHQVDGICFNHPMAYSDVVKRIQRSCCILELLNPGQHGNTLRFKEAICYNRKLITNNPDVLKSKYYNPRWIHFFNRVEDIDAEWIMNGDTPEYKYGGEFSPLRLLEIIENSNIK